MAEKGKKQRVRDSLIKQLQEKGADMDHFLSLVDDYIWYWEQEEAMQRDVKKRGRTYEAISASGKEYEKENPSVKNALLYNKQKLAILKELELNTRTAVNDDDDAL